MTVDSRDQLWELTFETLYDSSFEEMVADNLITKWQLVDEITKVSAAVTASGSVVAGWALWNQEPFKVFWAVAAGLAALLVIVHAALGVPTHLKDLGERGILFTMLRLDLETLMGQMRLNPEFSIDDYNSKFLKYRERYKAGIERLKPDILRTSWLERRLQNRLNEHLKDRIEEQ